MSFTWPLALLGLLVVPVLLTAYIWQLRRKRRGAVRFSSVALLRAALPGRSSWKRHVPVALFLVGLAGMGVAAARPQATTRIPVSRTSIIMAIDVSRSMCSTDVSPNRLVVAQDAARSFIKAQPDGARIGIVAFSGFAELVVPPTNDRDQLVAAIDSLVTGRGTAIGSATMKSLQAVSEVNPDVTPLDDTALYGDASTGFSFRNGEEPAEIVPPREAPEEGYIADIVVLLTDGANTRGIDPIEAAKQAAERRVRVYTIGFGTEEPTGIVCTRQQLGGDAFGEPFGGGGFTGGGGGGFPGGGGGGFRRFQMIDVETLTSVANMTGGAFFRAEDAQQLHKTFEDLPKQVQLQQRDVELSAAFTAAGAVLAGLAMVLSLLWNRTP